MIQTIFTFYRLEMNQVCCATVRVYCEIDSIIALSVLVYLKATLNAIDCVNVFV